MSRTTNKFSPEVRSRAVRLVLEHEHPSRWATILSIAPKIGCTGATGVRSRIGSQCERDDRHGALLDADMTADALIRRIVNEVLVALPLEL
jgi:transposase-like protein